VSLAESAYALEIDYLPLLAHPAIRQDLSSPTCLISSVGMRPQPVLLTIACLKPQSIVFVHTRETETQVHQIAASPGWNTLYPRKPPFTVNVEIDPLDSTRTYGKLVAAIKGGGGANWVVDITGGRKVMGAVLSAFAFWRHIPVVYLNSREVHGVPEPFSERLVRIDNPYETYGDPLLAAAERAFNHCQFDAAIGALHSLRETVSLADLDHRVSIAEQLIECYMLWDRFEHSDEDGTRANALYKRFEKAAAQYARFKYSFFKQSAFDGNCKFIKQLKSTYKALRRSLMDEFRLADIFCNSARKASLSFFDDALARLYRCTEMAVTMMLRKLVPDFDPDRANWRTLRARFPTSDLNQLYAECSKDAPDTIRGLPDTKQVGLAVQAALIGAVAKAILASGMTTPEMQQLLTAAESVHRQYVCARELFGQRNRSILAHGTKPVSDSTYLAFAKVVDGICSTVVGKARWRELKSGATFAELRLTV